MESSKDTMSMSFFNQMFKTQLIHILLKIYKKKNEKPYSLFPLANINLLQE